MLTLPLLLRCVLLLQFNRGSRLWIFYAATLLFPPPLSSPHSIHHGHLQRLSQHRR